MSASTIVVQCAAVRSERTMCSAMRLRITESSRPPGAAAAGAAAGGALLAIGGFHVEHRLSTLAWRAPRTRSRSRR